MTTLTNGTQSVSVWDEWFNKDYKEKPEPVIKTNNDTLVLSVHLWNTHQGRLNERFQEFSMVDKEYQVETAHDIELAEKISQHFGRQILSYALAGRLTRWQEAVDTYLRGDRHGYTTKTQGLIYRLPEYYFKDMEIEAMDSEHFSNCTNSELPFTTELTLEPVKIVGRNLSSGDRREYWFLDREHNTPAMVSFRKETELLYIWDHYFATKQTMVINGRWEHTKHPRGVRYYTTKRTRLVNL